MGGRMIHSRAPRARHLASALLFGAALVMASCSNDSSLATAPTGTATVSTQSGVSVSALSNTVFAQPRSNAFCPAIDPFFASMVIVVQPNGAPGFFVSQLQLQFTDTFGRAMPQVTLPAPVPTTQFGSALDAARSSLAFPVTLGFGCGGGRSGTVLVIVSTRDALGHIGTGRMQVTVH
jgi:hypothetical protein